LRRQVAGAARDAGGDAFICAVLSFYLPYGGSDELWLTLTGQGRTITRVRSLFSTRLYRITEMIRVEKVLTQDDATSIRQTLEGLGIWSLPHQKEGGRDGWVCAVAAAAGARVHSIQMHVDHQYDPPSPHVALVLYLLSLAPLPDEHRQHDVARHGQWLPPDER
jgi:hypothetical protein